MRLRVHDRPDRIRIPRGNQFRGENTDRVHISVELVMELLDGGRSEADIIRMYSHLTPEDIRACREYAATGVKLYSVTREDIDAIMDGKEA